MLALPAGGLAGTSSVPIPDEAVPLKFKTVRTCLSEMTQSLLVTAPTSVSNAVNASA
jgi:hypothetical protein